MYLAGGQAMLPTTGARTRYLALALASRKLIDSLLTFVESNQQQPQDPQLGVALRQFVDSLETTKAGNNLFGELPSQPPFSHYEQVLTLQEALESFGDGDIENELSGVLDERSDITTRKQRANKAIEFFYALENRALNHYNQQMGTRDL
jgi:hypothetical protein